VKHRKRENNLIWFTASLVAVFIVAAIVDSTPLGENHILVRLVILASNIVALMSLDFGARWRYFMIVMILLIVFFNSLDQYLGYTLTAILALSAALVFFIGMATVASRQILFTGRVNLNTIIGALALYLLLGLIWATLYLITLEIFPEAFRGMAQIQWADNFSTALYFSYVTMTSLGYGDISPTLPISQVLAYLQAVVGTFYMAIVVASLVGARTSRKA
jgi:hypothetical protein